MFEEIVFSSSFEISLFSFKLAIKELMIAKSPSPDQREDKSAIYSGSRSVAASPTLKVESNGLNAIFIFFLS